MRRAVAHYLPREMAVLGLVEFALSFAAIYLVTQIAGAPPALPAFIDLMPRGNVALAAAITLVIGGLALIVGLYRPEVCRNRARLLTAAGLIASITCVVLLFAGLRPHDRLASIQTLYMAEVLAAWLATLSLVRVIHGVTSRRLAIGRRILLLGDQRQIRPFSLRLQTGRGRRFALVTPQPQSISWPLLRQHGIWGVVVASDPARDDAEALLDCKLRGMKVLSRAAFHEHYLARIDLDAVTAADLLISHGFAVSRGSAALKRLTDLVIGTSMLVALLPVMALTALAIKIDSPGPVLYRQQRVGQFDKTFTLFKFRSMTADAETGGRPRWAQKQDPRVTRVGRIIRSTRIDELPQLANVLRGEMTMVGPRPERPHFVEQLVRAIPLYRERTYVKPGLTGWAQVNFPYGASVEDAREKLAYDLYYVKNRSLLLDLIILASTIRVVLFREGAR